MSGAPSRDIERQALDQAPVLIRDLEGRITLWAKGLERIYGYTSDLCVGLMAHDLLQTQFPAPRSEIEAEVRGRGVWSGELLERRRDGQEITVSSRWSLLLDQNVASVMICNSDITGDRRALHDHRFLASIVESSQDAVMGKNLQGIVTSWNRAAEQMFGYTQDEIVGQSVTMLFPEDLIGEEAMILDRLRRGDRIEHYETVRRHKDGRPVHVSLTVSPIFDANRVVIGASKSARDIGERIALTKRLDDLQAALLHTSRVNEMGQLASAIAHELNQPLAAVSLFVGGARRHVELGNIELAMEGCRRAETEVIHTAAILERLGNFVKKGPMRCRGEALAGVIDDAIALALLNPITRDLKIEVHIADDAQTALIDRIQIQQVLLNLIRNAAQAMEGLAVKSMSISAERMDADMMAIEVSDHGPGLPPEVLARLFEPFHTTKPDGMGIGLSLCQSVVRAHGGEMAAANAAGGGAAFVFTLITPPYAVQ